MPISTRRLIQSKGQFNYSAIIAKVLQSISRGLFCTKVNEAGRNVNEGGKFTDIWMYLVNRRNSDSCLPTRFPWTFVVTSIKNSFLSFRVTRALSLSSSDDLVCRFCTLIIEQIRSEIERNGTA